PPPPWPKTASTAGAAPRAAAYAGRRRPLPPEAAGPAAPEAARPAAPEAAGPAAPEAARPAAPGAAAAAERHRPSAAHPAALLPRLVPPPMASPQPTTYSPPA